MTQELISISTFCSLHRVDEKFINSLENEGLIRITVTEQGAFIDEEQLHQLEVFTQWYQLGINTEGMDAITHLVQRLRDMQIELNRLRSRLKWYEQGNSGMEI